MSAALKQDELQLKIIQIQNDFKLKIEQAVSQNNFNAIQKLSVEMSEKIEKLVNQTVSQFSNQSLENLPVYSYEYSELKLDDYVYSGEKEHYLKIKSDSFLGPLIDSIKSTDYLKSSDADLAKRALKLDLRFSSNIQSAAQQCQEALKLSSKVEFYVVSNSEINAFCMPSEAGTIKIGFTSAMLEKFSSDELAFVIGHEIGHALYKHSSVPSQRIINSEVEGITPLHISRLQAWKRAIEITADRIGLLCCNSFETAARTLFKVSYGLEINDNEAINHYMNEFQDTEKLMKAHLEPKDFLISHPFGPIRLVAIQAFSESEVFNKHLGHSEFKMNNQDMEQKIDTIVSVFESTYLDNPESLNKDLSDFLLLGGIIVSQSDGEFDPTEFKALSLTLQRILDQNEINEILAGGPEMAWKKLEGLSEKLLQTIFPRQRLMLVKDLCHIALADGKVLDYEFNVLVKIANTLNINKQFIIDVYDGLTEDI